MSRAIKPIVVLPLDDRPVNTKDIYLSARAAGSQVVLPPPEMLPPCGAPSDLEGITNWLLGYADGQHDFVISANQLLFGGYVASRRTTSSLSSVLQRLEIIAEIRERAPECHISTHMTVMRTKDVNDAGAEPEYWSEYGAAFGTLSREIFREEHDMGAAVDEARGEIPEIYVQDYLQRRLRLATVHHSLISMAAEGLIDDLALLVEDSTPQSLSSTEREVIDLWISRLNLSGKVQCLPGADEAGASLTMRAILRRHGLRPRVHVACATPDGLESVAQYEDVPLRTTISQQLWMVGAVPVESRENADLILVVHPPTLIPYDWCRRPDEKPATADVAGTVSAIEGALESGRPVAVADLAYANGADPNLIDALNDASLLYALNGYAGWNTAGNSIGSALVQGCAAVVGEGAEVTAAQKHLLTRRVLDEGFYQARLRRHYQESDLGGGARVSVEKELSEGLASLRSDFHTLEIRQGSTNWPWRRTFEIDFDLQERECEKL